MWKPIRDYTVDLEDLKQQELKSLKIVWDEKRKHLEQRDAFIRFNEQLKREWAIETGLIERLYVLDRGVTQLLIERGINSSLIPHGAVSNPDVVTSIINDHEKVMDQIFDFVKGHRHLSASYIKEVHALITAHQFEVEGIDSLGKRINVPLIRGDYKLQPNNPQRPDGESHEYCPPEQVSFEMDRLIDMHEKHMRIDVSPEVEAAWLHHRFTQIHPFQDGNGRVARAIATLIFVKDGWFPLVVKDSERNKYIGALEKADNGNLKPLVEYFSELQKSEIVKALSIAHDVLKSTQVEEVILAVQRDLQRRKDSLIQEWKTACNTADVLCEKVKQRLDEVSKSMQENMEGLVENAVFFANSAMDGTPKSHYFYAQIIRAAQELDYFANTHTYRSWVRMVMKNANQSELLVTFHGIGHEFQGVLACSVCWFQRVETEEGEREVDNFKLLVDRVFQINYKESLKETEERFDPWFEQSIVRAIDLWRMTAI